MADEITVNGNLTILSTANNIDFRKQISWRADLTGFKGPSVGAVSIATSATTIDLSELTTPGLIIFKNIDPTNFVEYGVDATGFQPLGELLPGEEYILRLSRNLGTLQFKADTAAVNVAIEAWEA